MKIGQVLDRTDRWINSQRVLTYASTFLVLYFGLWLFWILSGTGMLDRQGTIIGSDFLTVYTGSIFAQGMDPGRAYDLAEFHAVQNGVAGAEVKPLMWRYPPTAFLIVWPLALLPYLTAGLLWLLLTGAAFYSVVRTQITHRWTLLLFLSYAGFYQNWIQGQNAMLTGSLLCGGLVLSGRYPWWGGILLGVLAYKPQYAAMAMLFFLLRGEWRVLVGAAGSGLVLVGGSLVMYGEKPWHDFLASLPVTMMAVEGGYDPIHKLVTFFGALILAGVPAGAAKLLHWFFLFAVVGACMMFWRKYRSRSASLAVTVCGTLLTTPYAYDYELVMLAFPLAWLVGEGLRRGWQTGEKSFCLFVWLAPFLMPSLARATHCQLGWTVALGLLLVICRKAAQPAGDQATINALPLEKNESR